MRKWATALAVIVVVGLVGLPASASETCPEGDGWVKADGLSGLTYTFTPPEGYEVTDNCMKVGDHAPVFGSGATVTNTTLFNSPGGAVCTAVGVPVAGCSLQQISHASFKIVEIPPDDEESTTTTTTTILSTTSSSTIPTTTTTLLDTTTTSTLPVTSSTEGTSTSSTITGGSSPELPFTGPFENVTLLAGSAVAAIALGWMLVKEFRRED